MNDHTQIVTATYLCTEIVELKAKLAVAVEALEAIERGDDNGDKDIAEIALDKIRGEG